MVEVWDTLFYYEGAKCQSRKIRHAPCHVSSDEKGLETEAGKTGQDIT
jgi:hypothetical protein